MKNTYETYEDLKEAAEKLRFEVAREDLGGFALVRDLVGYIVQYNRTNRGWEKQGG